MSYYVIGGGSASGLGQDMLGRSGLKGAKGVKGARSNSQTVYRGGGGKAARHGIAVPGLRAQAMRHGMHGIFDAGPDPYVALLRRNSAGVSGFGAFGAADPGAVCSDWQTGGSCTDPNDSSCGPARAAGGRATTAIQQALNDQGYGPIAVDGIIGPETTSAWNRFADANPGTAHDWPDCAGITTLMSGAAVKGTGTSKAGVAFGILAAGLVALGALALLAKKKHKGAHHAAGHSEQITIRESR